MYKSSGLLSESKKSNKTKIDDRARKEKKRRRLIGPVQQTIGTNSPNNSNAFTMPPGRRGGGMRLYGSTIASLVNSSARSDEEARRQVTRTFGSLLVALFVADISCAFAVVVIQCTRDNDNGQDDPSTSTEDCVRRTVFGGLISFNPTPMGDDSDDHLGDLFVFATLRTIITSLLLVVGVQFGRHAKIPMEVRGTSPRNGEGSGTLTEPLLNSEAGPSESEASQSRQATTTGDDEANAAERANPLERLQCTPCTDGRTVSPAYAKNFVLVALFVSSTLYQVYAGLKVATFPSEQTVRSCIPLMCLTVLWINAEAYVFRTLLSELTREKGLFLPPEVHRHPMFFEQSRSMAFHWCDLCRQRIKADDGGVYRCSLCDFDVCLKCSRRNDAATVGENVLRGDRGVRVEASLSTGGYFKRSMKVAKNELPLLSVSFLLLAASSLSRLFLPHFQGHIIDKVIPDGDGNYDKTGFLRFIKIYIYLMLAQGALSTLYSAIFTLVSRRLKFTIRNSLFEKILAQDVAYFDGTESGQLISRLTNDLDLMMAPIQSSLSSLLSNILILFGGMIMCFMKVSATMTKTRMLVSKNLEVFSAMIFF